MGGVGGLGGLRGTGLLNRSSVCILNSLFAQPVLHQISRAGIEPVEVMTLVEAEAKLKEALMKMLQGDDAAEKAFNKYSLSVENHPGPSCPPPRFASVLFSLNPSGHCFR